VPSVFAGSSGLDVARLGRGQSRAITAENPTGGRGGGGRATEGTGANAARDLGVGWKVSPSRVIGAGERAELAAIEGPGTITHIWLTMRPEAWRSLVLRAVWEDDEGYPAVALPVGDLFGQGWAEYAPLMSEPVVVAPYGGLNCYFPMPFRKAARLSLENLGAVDQVVYYQVDYALGEVPDDVGYFHAHWRRSNPVPAGQVHTILDGAVGPGSYVGTYMAIGINGPGWWGEGEVKFYLDDEDHPSICGTGTEDYFGGAWDFDVPGQGYSTYMSPYLGVHQVIKPDGLYRAQTRFGMYRWHLPDPVSFDSSLRVTIQDLGWRSDGRYLPRSDDIATVAYWYGERAAGVEAQLLLDDFEVASRPDRRAPA
jgi:hypothetical protein